MKATKTPGIYKRSDTAYVVRVYDAAAKRYAVNKTYGSYKEAQTALTDYKQARNQGRGVKASNHTVSSLWTAYEPFLKADRKRNTAEAYASHFRNHVLPALGALKLRDVDSARMQLFIDALAAKKLSPATVHAVIASTSSAFEWARKRGHIGFNPTRGAELPELGTTEGRSLTRDECDRLLAATPKGWQLLVEVAIRTGLRQGELLALKWSSVVDGQLLIRDQLLRSGEHGATKTKRGVRQIPLTRDLQMELTAARLASRYSSDEDYIFVREDGSPRTHGAFYRQVRNAAQRAKLGLVTPHDCRHTAASNMVAAGVPPATVARVMGDRIETVMAVYVRDSGEESYTEQARQALAASF